MGTLRMVAGLRCLAGVDCSTHRSAKMSRALWKALPTMSNSERILGIAWDKT